MGISTHTSRVGCDAEQDKKASYNAKDFYSHIPCGMWQENYVTYSRAEVISTHTSRVGCDQICGNLLEWCRDFYSHIPCGMWQLDRTAVAENSDFYSHIPCGMWLKSSLSFTHFLIFLLTHPVWDVTAIYSIFQSHYSHILQDGPIIHLELY